MKKLIVSALLILVSVASFANTANIQSSQNSQTAAIGQQQQAATMARVPQWNR